jgi:DNA topoisomerase-3
MRLFIAEKPNMGRELARFLPGPHVKKDGYIETGGGYVAWCVGHILEQAPPEAYDEKYKQWNIKDLPILPDQWRMQVSESKRKQVSVIRDLLKKCSSVVNAGDPGREGQLIVDEVLEFLGNRKPVERILLNALDQATVTKALASMVNNQQFHNLYQAALGRQRADWLIGMNLTRAYTSLASAQGRRGVLSVGRVQTPTLAIVVRRDEEIENFKPQDYWTLQALLADPNQPNLPFWAKWLPKGVSLSALEKSESQAGVDPVEAEDVEEDEDANAASGTSTTALPSWLLPPNRVLDRAVAEKIAQELQQAGKATVTRYENKPAKESAPLPFELTGLQATISIRHGVSVKDVLDSCQSLYEKGFASYPRTDCSYLPTSQHGDAADILAGLSKAMPDLEGLVKGADPSIQGRAFNDAKMGEHHAIIPTRSTPNLSDLSDLERHIYRAISLQYLAQFYPDCLVDKATVEAEAAGHRLVAKGRVVKSPGWRVVFGNVADSDKGKETTPTLPTLQPGQVLDIREVKNAANQTKPPPRFNEGTLLKAMQHVDRLVSDPAEKKKLKAVEGIGRSATRAAIIETLLKRQFLIPQGKSLLSSSVGRVLVKVLPSDLTDPGLTARWETILDAIASGQVQLPVFEQRQQMWVKQLVTQAANTPLPPLPQDTNAAPAKRSGPSSSGSFSRGGSGTVAGSKSTGRSSGGAKKSAGGKAAPAGGGKPCPKCGQGKMTKREIKNGPHAGKSFLGCSNYPNCKHSEWP